MIAIRASVCLVLCVLFAKSALAVEYHKTSEGRAFIETMAKDYGFDAGRVESLLAQARRQDSILEAISRPAEKTMEWHRYRQIFIKPERIEQGVSFLQEHKTAFERAEQEFGVPSSVLAAIIGVETWYGRYRGNHRVLDALATLAFDYPPRSRFFRSELVQYLLMTREQSLDPVSMTGSYAGAMGYGQFIASSYRNFAIDFDGDGVANIFDNPVDAIGSVANYFHAHDWRSGEPVAERLDTQSLSSSLLTQGLKPTLTVADYQKAGVSVADGRRADAPARAIRLSGENEDELWLTYHNFYVITRYNHSHLYAMAVHQLSKALESSVSRKEAQIEKQAGK